MTAWAEPAIGSEKSQSRVAASALARGAGISVQQVRTYLAEGLLPAADRSPGGHRRFAEVHVAALATLRELAAGHGWAGARRIMRATHEGDLGGALAALDAGHAALDRERAEIAGIREAVESLVTAAPARPPVRPRHVGEVARLVGVRTPVLRAWERRGLLRPERERGTGYRSYDETQLRRARVVALLRRGYYPFPVIEAVLAELDATGDPVRVRAALAERESDLVRRSRRRLRASAAYDAYLVRWAPTHPLNPGGDVRSSAAARR